MDIVGKARKLERKIARSLDAAVGEFVAPGAVAPLEIIHLVLDRAEQEIQHAGRGRRVFPFTRVTVCIPTGRDRQTRARFEVVAGGPPSLGERLRARLEQARCAAPNVTVDVTYVAKPAATWASPDFHVEFLREELPAAPVESVAAQPRVVPRLKLTVVRGTSAHRHYLFSGGRIDIGRRAEVLDAKHRLVRTNHVVFDEDGGEINASVSRRHAHVDYDPDGCEYRLLDDRSTHGTGIVRNGRTVPVLAGSRGVRLQNGDEIVLGQARVKVTLDSAKDS
jgi:hypothetical protein